MRLYMVWEFRPILSKFSKSVTNEFGRKIEERGGKSYPQDLYNQVHFSLIRGKIRLVC